MNDIESQIICNLKQQNFHEAQIKHKKEEIAEIDLKLQKLRYERNKLVRLKKEKA